jgi:NNP family nitrate/nitrite transporter-like MFS transporter
LIGPEDKRNPDFPSSPEKPVRKGTMDQPSASFRPNLQLALGTVSFAICFAAWGLISAFAPHFQEAFHLTATQTAFLVAVPVLLGALLRVATGMLADRFGGRAVFALLMVIVAVPAYVVPMVPSYRMLLYGAFFLGMAGSSFAVGMGFVSRWFPPERQGGALGIYGFGNIGQSVAVFLGPVLAVAVGWQNIFRGMAALLVIWGIAFFLLARNSPKSVLAAWAQCSNFSCANGYRGCFPFFTS